MSAPKSWRQYPAWLLALSDGKTPLPLSLPLPSTKSLFRQKSQFYYFRSALRSDASKSAASDYLDTLQVRVEGLNLIIEAKDSDENQRLLSIVLGASLPANEPLDLASPINQPAKPKALRAEVEAELRRQQQQITSGSLPPGYDDDTD